jgi:hypothetical protein
VITATASAPESSNAAAFPLLMPPIATTGTESSRLASMRSSRDARTAPGFTLDAKKLPNAT